MRTAYRFRHVSEVAAPRERVHATLVDLEHYASWWPQVRAVAKVDDDNALVVCRSTLPYSLDLHLEAVRRDLDCLEVRLGGALDGFARWRLDEQGPDRTRLEFEQEVRVRAPMLVLASYAARPLLVWNHARMMRGADEGLAAALEGSATPASRRG